MVSQLNPAYTPWAESILEPPGGETESLLFCLQAGIGAGILGFGFGYLVARKKFHEEAGTDRGQVRRAWAAQFSRHRIQMGRAGHWQLAGLPAATP